MTAPLPNYCLYGDGRHEAAYLVEGRYREALACQGHLDKAKRWAGAKATVTPLAGHEPPPEQPPLF